MRPRILDPFFAEIAMLDATATRALSPDPPAVVAGFDDDFKEVVVFDQAGARQSARQEQDAIFLKCQIEVSEFDKLQQLATGNAPGTKLTIVVARKDLKAAGLINPDNGEPLVRSSDRLVSICDSCKSRIHVIRTPPGLYVTQVQPAFGLARGGDLFMFSFEDREQFQRG